MKRQKVILRDLSVDIFRDEIVCILGPSGAGKSTLMEIMSGFERPTSGSVSIDAEEVVKPSNKVTYIPQFGTLLPWKTVRQNLAFLSGEESYSPKVTDTLDIVDLLDAADLFPHQISGGMRKRVDLAKALLHESPILLLDEPFAGLDFASHLQLREELINLKRMCKMTLIVVTHDVDDALILSDRLLIFGKDGSEPMRLLDTIHVEASRPRKPDSPEMSETRRSLYFHLGIPYSV